MRVKRIVKTADIIEKIKLGFGKAAYQGATPLMDSGDLWNFCMSTIKDPIKMSCIAFANDLGVPPVKSLMTFFDRDVQDPESFTVVEHQSQNIGALMGFVFKFVLDYRGQEEKRRPVNMHGIGDASLFYDGPILEFTE